jgi:hypothetical protein
MVCAQSHASGDATILNRGDGLVKARWGPVVAWFEQIPHTGVILRDFSPEEPGPSQGEGMWRASLQLLGKNSDPLPARSLASSG